MTRHGQGFWAMTVAATVLAAGCGEPERPRQRTRRDAPAGDAVASKSAAGTEDGGATKKAAAAASVEGWGNIKGKVVWAGAEIPQMPDLDAQKDPQWCLAEGKIKAETLVVDPETKGVSNIFLYLSKPPAIHADYPQTAADVKAKFEETFQAENKIAFAELDAAVAGGKIKLRDIKAPVIIDQVRCRYVPHALAARQGQPTIVLNPEEIPHNVNVQSFKAQNAQNPNMPPNTIATFNWVTDTQPIAIACNIHGWMNMRAMCFDHPYYAVTGKDGTFELKNVPAGALTLTARGEQFVDIATGGKGTAKGNAITVKPDETLELTIEMKPQ